MAWIVVLAFFTCSVACATSVAGEPQAQRGDRVVELREPLSFRPVLENDIPFDPAARDVQMLDYMGFVIEAGVPFLTVATVESVTVSRGANDSDHVVDILLTESDRGTFEKWAARHSGRKVVATTTKSAYGYIQPGARQPGQPVRFEDSYTVEDATDIIAALVG
ncbi:MAG TPA: hypothetical protein VGP26_29530 [Actinophytocola sp.]|nr:hypothetical protein [Actinophytocola sp.]